MLYPSIDELVLKVDSKYTLAVAAAKRARQLRDGAKTSLKNVHSNKYVGNALEEIYGDKVHYERIDDRE